MTEEVMTDSGVRGQRGERARDVACWSWRCRWAAPVVGA
jgi:hypothetical protein